ncbi:unnamed protein product [Protopolystoma xenopodis]|uniref:PHD-type domain-containing protein n=1 Tax=Protopolystoma xenopodis TaxID=117903 RepID=A0A3S4ZY69_9PLAT|nr:unnamed protein product [Protopolystoma xenopodis]
MTMIVHKLHIRFWLLDKSAQRKDSEYESGSICSSSASSIINAETDVGNSNPASQSAVSLAASEPCSASSSVIDPSEATATAENGSCFGDGEFVNERNADEVSAPLKPAIQPPLLDFGIKISPDSEAERLSESHSQLDDTLKAPLVNINLTEESSNLCATSSSSLGSRSAHDGLDSSREPPLGLTASTSASLATTTSMSASHDSSDNCHLESFSASTAITPIASDLVNSMNNQQFSLSDFYFCSDTYWAEYLTLLRQSGIASYKSASPFLDHFPNSNVCGQSVNLITQLSLTQIEGSGEVKMPEVTKTIHSVPQMCPSPYEVTLIDAEALSVEADDADDPRRCLLCDGIGDDGIEGRLLYTGTDTWVHVNCALWSNEVYEEDSGQLRGLVSALCRARSSHCLDCGRAGATLICSNQHGHCPSPPVPSKPTMQNDALASLSSRNDGASVLHFTCALQRRRSCHLQPIFTADRSFFCSPTCHSAMVMQRLTHSLDRLRLRRGSSSTTSSLASATTSTSRRDNDCPTDRQHQASTLSSPINVYFGRVACDDIIKPSDLEHQRAIIAADME